VGWKNSSDKAASSLVLVEPSPATKRGGSHWGTACRWEFLFPEGESCQSDFDLKWKDYESD
jgi:hypothetical protein